VAAGPNKELSAVASRAISYNSFLGTLDSRVLGALQSQFPEEHGDLEEIPFDKLLFETYPSLQEVFTPPKLLAPR
jgi:hypothetical protein